MEDCLEEFIDDFQFIMLLLDINLFGMNGLCGIWYFKEKCLDFDIIMLINKDSLDYIFKVFCVGVVFYILKKKVSLLVLWEVVVIVLRGEFYMLLGIVCKVIQYFVLLDCVKVNLVLIFC